MRVLLIIILGSVCAWLAYDRSKLQEQLAAANSKLAENSERASRPAAPSGGWLAERLAKRTDPLAKPPDAVSRRTYNYGRSGGGGGFFAP